ncbi:MAG: hypothetical protein FJ189_14415, partial [Gammaproteobacteria bacterium]|nr:hypothetical protein [Gammaproteobacteria bacterium]
MKIGLASSALAAMLFVTPTAPFAADVRQETIHFQKGASHALVRGSIKGSKSVDYTLHAKGGQAMVIDFKPSNLSAYFNVLPPGSETALFVGSSSGNRFEGTLPADGVYTIQVYLMRNAARRNE